MPVPVPVPVPMPVPAHNYHQQDAYAAARALAPAVHADASVNLLNSLLAFYHQERTWVQRTRASLELAFVQGPLIGAPPPPGSCSESESDSDGSAPTAFGASSENTSNEPTPATSAASESGAESDACDVDVVVIKQEEGDDVLPPPKGAKGYGPLTLRATMPARAPSSRWLKRKQTFKLHLGPLSAKTPTRPRMRKHFDGTEPSAELLERFGELMEARMDSCMRITQLIRESNRALLRAW